MNPIPDAAKVATRDPANPKAPMNVFKSRLPSVRYIFKNGKDAVFIQGRYLTNVKWEIDELQHEVDMNHPHIYVDENEATFDLSKNDALAGLRDRFMAEFLAMTPAERAGLQRIDPNNPNGPLHTPSPAEMIQTDPTVGQVGYSDSDQKFRIKVASSADAAGGANNLRAGAIPGTVGIANTANSGVQAGVPVPSGFLPATEKPAASTLESLKNKMHANKSSEPVGNMPNSENKTSDGIAGT